MFEGIPRDVPEQEEEEEEEEEEDEEDRTFVGGFLPP